MMKITVGVNNFCTCAQTSSPVCSASILRKPPCCSSSWRTGNDSLVKVAKRFLMDSKLSSVRPLVLPRSRSRACIVDSPHSKKRLKRTFALDPTTWFHPSKLSKLLGNPSIKYFPPSQPCCSMAFTINLTVISTGTNLPSVMYDSISSPYSDPIRFRSSRSKSPALKCLYPFRSTMFAHCVPFPEPGPPRTNTTAGPKRVWTSPHTFSTACSALMLFNMF
mmetsp:Transcript_69301/g.225799  ORF Transcript_69301/g.225799 Transcript_69301/m.225799 type:complete len:220 (+) Transcript_69301:3267-3926(+)